MKSFLKVVCVAVLSLNLACHAGDTTASLKALIIDGQNNHTVWPKSTIMMKQYLEDTGLFTVDIDRTQFTWKAEREEAFLPLAGVGETQNLKNPKSDPDFSPNFDQYDVVISNFGWKAANWPQATQKALEAYMTNGGGFVVVHAADNCFPEWHEYNKMIGLGGWGGRNEKDGPYVYFTDEGKQVRDDSPGGAGAHGPQHEFAITLRDTNHPITRGMPPIWKHAKDECYAKLRGPAENLTILATGRDVSGKAPTQRHEPILMVLDYGKGRVFHTTLGHDDYSCEGVGFIASFTRGAEWAATGSVTQKIPADFPTAEKGSSRKFELKKKDSYESLYNGRDLDNWKLMCRSDDPELPKKVFTPGENGELHVFRDFPAGYGVSENKNATHGMMFTRRSYSRYSFKFEYKWGKKLLNNFKQFQYDAGCYYHTFEENVWPKGIEYQVRYNHIEDRNHTGDIWNSGTDFQWVAGPGKTYLPESEGGVKQPHRGGEHRARTDAEYHALDDQWNQCEVIVMGNQYAIHKLNGKVVNMLTDLRHSEGTIGLQAETADIFYRNIMIKEFDKDIPAEVFLKEVRD